MKQTQTNDNIIRYQTTPFGSTGSDTPIFYEKNGISEKIELIDEILNHKFNTFSADTALMLGNQKLSTVNKKIVIEWQEIADYLIKTKSQLEEIWKKANNK
jgi:hypothetical protein